MSASIVVRTLLTPVCCVLGILPAASSWAQEIVLDRSVRAGELVLFESLQEGEYYYAPTRARLATENGKPQFSFLRYVENVRAGDDVRTGEGGGIVHAVVQLGVTDAERDAAERELRRIVPGAVLRGPVIFRSGTFGLVTSFTADNGELADRVVGLGSAPILDGSKAAVSIALTKLGATLLWESFQTATPDISFMFEMEMQGYRAPKRAVIEAEMDRVYSHRAFDAAVATTYLQAEITQAFEELRSEGAIRLTQVGEDEQLQGLIDTAYSKLTDLVFAPNTGDLQSQVAGLSGDRKSALDRASELLETRRKEAREINEEIRRENAAIRERAMEDAERLREMAKASKQAGDDGAAGDYIAGLASFAEFMSDALQAVGDEMTATDGDGEGPGREEIALPEFAAVVSFQMKESRQSGLYRVDLNKYTADTLSLRFDENIGDLGRFLDDDSIFRSVNTDDALYRQREIVATLTSVNDASFDKSLAFVNLQVRKTHQNGDRTLEERLIDRALFTEQANRFRVIYGWKGDTDRRKWERYEYRAVWGLQGRDPIEGEWTEADLNVIPLRPPFRQRTVELDAGDGDLLKEAGVRSVDVRFFVGDSDDPTERLTLRTSRGDLSRSIDMAVLPSEEVRYEIDWQVRGGPTLSSGPLELRSKVLYLDEFPEEEGAR